MSSKHRMWEMVKDDSEATESCETRPIMDWKLLFYRVFGVKLQNR